MSGNGMLHRAREGDEVALNNLLRQWYPRVYQFALKYFAEADKAREIAQQTMIKIHQKLGQLKDEEAFIPWLYQIAGNLCHEEKRQQKRRSWLSFWSSREEDPHTREQAEKKLVSGSLNPEGKMHQDHLNGLLQKALKQLGPEQRMVVIMKEYEGLKFREIAKALGISENTAKSRLYYGLKNLRKIFAEWNVKPENTYYEQ